jgi:hypothetical protein
MNQFFPCSCFVHEDAAVLWSERISGASTVHDLWEVRKSSGRLSSGWVYLR